MYDTDIEVNDLFWMGAANADDVVYLYKDKEYSYTEEDIKIQIVLPVLQSLGWNIFCRSSVRYERNTGNGNCDILLLDDYIPVGIIEVKRYTCYEMNEGLEASLEDCSKSVQNGVEQLNKYLADTNLRFGVITDGVNWILCNGDTTKYLCRFDSSTDRKSTLQEISYKTVTGHKTKDYYYILEDYFGD